MDREKVYGKHNDNGYEHFGHFPTCAKLIVKCPVGRIGPGKGN